MVLERMPLAFKGMYKSIQSSQSVIVARKTRLIKLSE